MLSEVVENKVRGLAKRLLGLWFRFIVLRRGGRIGTGLVCFGLPILWRHRAAGLRIGDDVVFSAWQWANAINLGGPTRLSLLDPAAIIAIGDRSGLSSCTISAQASVEIGVETLIGAGVMITDTDFHILDAADRRYNRGGAEVGAAPVRIGDRVWIGAGATILKGARIGNNSIIAAGSVVTGEIPENVLAGGIPARVIRNL